MNNQVNINVCGVQGAPYTYKTVVLKPNVVGGKNILTQLMMGQTNTKYVIKYDYVIDPDIQTGIASVSESNISHCVNPNYAAALAAYNLAHDAWIDADNAYTNNPNDTTLAAKNAAYAAYTAAQTTLNNTPQFYYYAANAILVKQGQYISIPKGCVLLNASLSGITDFVVAPVDTTVYIGSLTAGEYNYTVQNAIVIPSGCLIEFDGGSISAGVLVGDETILIFDQEEDVVLKNVELLGEFEYSAGGSGGVDKKDNVDGMATITLKKKKNFASQLTQPNTIYRIVYDFDLGNESVTIPEGCILEFDGGSLNNGTVIGRNTGIAAGLVKIFDADITLEGSWNVKEGYPQWFGIYPDDDSVDTTPAIKKMVAVSIPIFFCAGVWYLSECLLNGKANVNLKGETTHYKTGTVFKAFNPNGQRFILKLGGNADFSKPTDYHAVWCSNLVLDGINFNTTNTHFVNANPSMGQNYAAVCFDWCVEGYVNIRHEGACPAVFIANTWEVYFESITCYGSFTNLNESAVYFGKCYTDIVSANISAVTINNLFGETIYGKFVDSHANSNIADLIINNIEFEPYSGSPSHVSHYGESAYPIIENNIRNIEYLYYFNFSGHEVCIHSLACCTYPVTYDNDTIARGLVKAINSATNVTIDNIINVHETYVINILGADNGARLKIGNLISQRWSGNISVYKDINPISDFANTLGVLPHMPGIITIENTTAVIDKDIIKLCEPGLLFNSKNVGEFSTLMWASYRIVPISGLLDGNSAEFIYFNQTTVSKKLKFDGNRLIIRYTAPNKYESQNIIITYYKNNNIVNTESIKLPYSDTKILTYQYDIYADDYDYCNLQFKSSTCIESIYLENIVTSTDDQKVVLFGSEINNDVIRIMSHYTRDDAYKRAALQYFFNKIGDIKNKLNHIILPIFANNLEEAIYDIITESQFTNIDGNNYLEFNKPTRRLHMTIEVTSDNWSDGSYRLYDNEGTFEGALTVLSATDGNGYGNINFYDNCWVRLNDASLGYFEPFTTNNHKIIGCGIVSNNGSSYLMRLGDKEESDKLTSVSSLVGPWRNTCQIFGRKPSDNTRGVRILVSTGELITADEAKILRDAVIELDDKFAALDEVNDNYTPSVEKLLIPNSGTWNDKPSSTDISIGFAYFCTDKQTEEGAADGIMIYYKGQDTTDPDNPVDVWVDALGRVVS